MSTKKASNKSSKSDEIYEEARPVREPFVRLPFIDMEIPQLRFDRSELVWYLFLITVVGALALMSGLLYVLSESPLPIGTTQRGFLLTHPVKNGEFVIEFFIVFTIFTLGSIGIFLFRYAATIPYNLQRATFLELLGGFLILAAIVMLTLMLNGKR